MAPSLFGDVLSELGKRQAVDGDGSVNVPGCVVACMAAGNTTGCVSATDYACLCKSAPYLDTVTTCWQSTCTADAITYGQQYAQRACAAFGVDLNATTPTTNTSVPSVNLYADPVLFQKAFVNVQAVMSSVCAALFAIAVILGIFACRKRIRLERETAQRSTWTGVGGTTLNATDTKGATSRFGISRGGATSSRGVDSNFDITSMSTLRYNQASSYTGFTNRERDPNAPSLNRIGFTNRLTLGDMGDQEWEMSEKNSPTKEADNELGPDSPTGSTSKIGESTVDLGDDEKREGSTVELNSYPNTKEQAGQAI